MNIRTSKGFLGRSARRAILNGLLPLGWCAVVCLSTARGQTTDTIATNWNATPANDALWISSTFDTSSPITNGATFNITNASVSFPFNGPTQTVTLPNATITFSSSFSTETTTFNKATNTWITDVPLSDAGKNIFMTGGEYLVPSPGILNNITGNQVSMTATFGASQAGEIMWQWSAAAYNTLNINYNTLGVLPIATSGLQPGTPSNFANPAFVDSGGSGNGGSNFTGNNSATNCIWVPVVVPEPSSALLMAAAMLFCFRRRRE